MQIFYLQKTYHCQLELPILENNPFLNNSGTTGSRYVFFSLVPPSAVSKGTLWNHGLLCRSIFFEMAEYFSPPSLVHCCKHTSLFANLHIQQGSTQQASHGNFEFPMACPFKMTNFWPLPQEGREGNTWRKSFILCSMLSLPDRVESWYYPRFLLAVPGNRTMGPIDHWIKGPSTVPADWLPIFPAPNLFSVFSNCPLL